MNELQLQPLTDDDIPLFKKWLYLPHVEKWYHDPLDWIYEVESRKDEFSFLNHFIANIDGKPIGFCQYYEYCKSGEVWHGNLDIAGVYSIDYMIGEPAYLGKGCGKKMLELLLQKIKAQADAKTVIVQPELENKASCNVLKSLGFEFDDTNEVFLLKL